MMEVLPLHLRCPMSGSANRSYTPEDRAFLRTIMANPAELTSWLVYADWLDERDDPRGRYIRLEVRLLDPDLPQTERYGLTAEQADLRAHLDSAWVAIFDRPAIENCDVEFAFKCPKQWNELRGTKNPRVRHCDACKKKVFYCRSVEEARQHARSGECVSIVTGTERHPGDLEERVMEVMGMLMYPGPDPEPPPRRRWWKLW